MSQETISSQKKSAGASVGCLGLFFLVFFTAGAALLWLFSIRPMLKVQDARTWPPVPCTVTESRVEESRDSDGTTYKAVITGSYAYQGQEYGGARYDFTNYSSSGYDGKAAIVARYPVGTRTECYVNPADPAEAVLDRSASSRYLLGLFGLIFMLPGLFGGVWALRGGGRKDGYAVADPASPFGVSNPQGEVSGPVELKPQSTPVGKFVGILIFTLIWNGFTWGALYMVLREEGGPEGCAVLVLSLFGLLGLLMIWGTIRQFLVLFNPRPKLTLSPGTLTPGGTAYLQWRLAGGTGGVRRLAIQFEGREEARYRRGTDTTTDKNTFAVIPILDTTQEFQMASGSTSFTLPPDTIPSFTAENNRIVWTIKATLELSGWPDSDEEFEILVAP